jgi:hypothetical protein
VMSNVWLFLLLFLRLFKFFVFCTSFVALGFILVYVPNNYVNDITPYIIQGPSKVRAYKIYCFPSSKFTSNSLYPFSFQNIITLISYKASLSCFLRVLSPLSFLDPVIFLSNLFPAICVFISGRYHQIVRW